MLSLHIVNGLALGAVYALVALGFVVIYRASQVFNFAQGELLAFGAFLMIALFQAGVPWGLALVLTMVITGLLGVLIERVFLRPLVGRPVFVTIIVTIFVAMILHAGMMVGWGPEMKGSTPTPWNKAGMVTIRAAVTEGSGTININEASLESLGELLSLDTKSLARLSERKDVRSFAGETPFHSIDELLLCNGPDDCANPMAAGYPDDPTCLPQVCLNPKVYARIKHKVSVEGESGMRVVRPALEVPVNSVVSILIAVLALGLFFLVIRFTRLGIAMRATASDQETSLAMGIPVGRVFAWSWFIAGAFAALGGALLGLYPRQVELNLAYTALAAFPAVVVGGLDSAVGAVIGGFLLGLLVVLCQVYIEPAMGHFGKDFHEVFPYLMMILVLVVRPYGLFGSKDVERV